MIYRHWHNIHIQMHTIVTPIPKFVHKYRHDGREMAIYTTHPNLEDKDILSSDFLNLAFMASPSRCVRHWVEFGGWRRVGSGVGGFQRVFLTRVEERFRSSPFSNEYGVRMVDRMAAACLSFLRRFLLRVSIDRSGLGTAFKGGSGQSISALVRASSTCTKSP